MGRNVGGAATPALALSNVQVPDVGNYDVVVTNTFGSVTSTVATLMVIPRTPPTILANDASFGFRSNTFGFNISGSVGQVVVVEVSTNPLHWTALQTITLGSGTLYFSDPESAGMPQRFYRAVLKP